MKHLKRVTARKAAVARAESEGPIAQFLENLFHLEKGSN